MVQGKRVVLVMPAYNAARTLQRTHEEVMQQGIVDLVIVVDDASHDDTVALARTLSNTKVHTHDMNRGYGANQKGEWGNKEFVTQHIAGYGALGDYFNTQLKGVIKMGDTPSVARLLHGTPEDPTQPSWGGKYVRIWDGRKTIFDRPTTEADQAEVFGVTEFVLPVPEGYSATNSAKMIFDNGKPPAEGVNEGKVLRFRFAPRDAKVWSYVIKSDFAGLDGQSGKFAAVPPPAERTSKPSTVHPNWWIDDPDPAVAEGVHPGAKSVNQWREDFLRDFAARMLRCKTPAPQKSGPNP